MILLSKFVNDDVDDLRCTCRCTVKYFLHPGYLRTDIAQYYMTIVDRVDN